ncbi:hypothetical protein [Brevibacterium luteolum]|uniref:Uncharacterized protein n=2 Tax=Brevibacterium luteolum TaxID=199591 RepID=A0A849AVN8_9MICO|nr:hypothetical protein [Brevibacterium luteolum]MBM7530132.1 hypothetical protein [Brevibacterium luteolum]MCT1657179.1 hypothetical protein [Brevibacterium luteolum]MCT1920758.1 hypothetical protein [Brevibacterium luteolum]NNG80121.1 hypothetical protein [Brevibacterium luteolum]
MAEKHVRIHRRRMIIGAVLVVVGLLLVLGWTVGTSFNSPFAGSPVQYTMIALGVLGLIGGALLGWKAVEKH